MQQLTRYIGIALLCLALIFTASGCGSYVGPINIYGLTDDDHLLLYNADPVLNYKMDHTLIIVVESGDIEGEIVLDGTGAVLISDDTLLPGLQFDFEGTAESNAGVSEAVKLQAHTLDGVFYFNSVGAGLSESDNWMKLDIINMLADMIGGTPEEILESFTSDTDQTGRMISVIDALQLYNFSTVTLLGEEEIKGVNTRHFLIQLDLLEFLTSNQMMGYLSDPTVQDSMGGQDVAGMLPMITMILPMLIPEFSMEVDQYVAIDTGYIQRAVTEVDLQLNLSLLGGLPTESGETLDELIMKMRLETDYHDFGEPVEIEIPDEAVEVDLETLFGFSLGQ